MENQLPVTINIDGIAHDYNYLEFIAAFRPINEIKKWEFECQALLKTPENSYLLRTDYKYLYRRDPLAEEQPFGSMVFGKTYDIINDPASWLLTHGHERLATFLFPGIADEVLLDLIFNREDERKYRGETFYSNGETKGETFRGKWPKNRL